MLPQLLDFETNRFVLRKHHVKNSALKRLAKGCMSVYDIEKSDIHKQFLNAYNSRGKKFSFPVILIIDNVTRLLIFNRNV